MDLRDIPFLTAAELARLLQDREVSPVEATEAYLQRIERLEPQLHSYITVCGDEAMAASREAEAEIARGNYRGPMHGIPIAVKDQIWTKGIRTTAGSRMLEDFVPGEDAAIIERLKEAGAVLLGKASLTEYALSGTYHGFETPRNPWDLDRYTGGSSSGSAAATSAYLCATSLGEDTGGSIMMPAAWCGIVGMFSSWGRVPRHGVFPCAWHMDNVGPMSRTVEDAAITLQTICGHDPRDPYSWDIPVPDFRSGMGGDLKGLRVGIISELASNPNATSEASGAFEAAMAVIGELGASVEEISLPLTADLEAIKSAPWPVDVAALHLERLKTRYDEYGRETRRTLLFGSLMPAQAHYKAQKLRTLLRRQVFEVLERVDVLACITSGRGAEKIQERATDFTGKQMILRLPYLFTGIYNLAGCPAITVPCGFTSDGMPLGVHLGARPADEVTLFKAAHAYEQATPWHTRRPPGV